MPITARKRLTSARKTLAERCTYKMEIRDWSTYYAFGQGGRNDPLRFSQVAMVSMEGWLIEPDLKDQKSCAIKVSFATFDLEMGRKADEPVRIGEIYRRHGDIEAHVVIHKDGAQFILPALLGGRAKLAILFGQALHYGSATVDTLVVETKSPYG